ncbi:MAG: hypothetical protein FWD69_18985 [Polyangiaceae bacterium]|nr:hypothetical protein [Polyangiaceae bacterium]
MSAVSGVTDGITADAGGFAVAGGGATSFFSVVITGGVVFGLRGGGSTTDGWLRTVDFLVTVTAGAGDASMLASCLSATPLASLSATCNTGGLVGLGGGGDIATGITLATGTPLVTVLVEILSSFFDVSITAPTTTITLATTPTLTTHPRRRGTVASCTGIWGTVGTNLGSNTLSGDFLRGDVTAS